MGYRPCAFHGFRLFVRSSLDTLAPCPRKMGRPGRIFTLSRLDRITKGGPWSYLGASISLFHLSRKNDGKLTWKRVSSARGLLEKDTAYPLGHSFPCAHWGPSHPFSLHRRNHGIHRLWAAACSSSITHLSSSAARTGRVPFLPLMARPHPLRAGTVSPVASAP